jgi:hypothetical protein
MQCVRRLHTRFKAQALLQTTPVTIRTFNTTPSTQTPLPIQLDSDSHTLILDNGCSASITNCMDDFVSPPWRVRANIEGYSGSTSATHVGTVCWKIGDDLGHIHDVLLPNTYYSPHGKHRLLCPQHWAQTVNDHHPQPNGTWCATYADCVILYWDQQNYQRTVKLLPHSNVGVIRTAPGYLQYAHTCSVLEKRVGVLAMPATIDLGPTPIQSMQSPETSETVPIVSNSEGENPIDTSQTTHEASQQESPDNQPFTSSWTRRTTI